MKNLVWVTFLLFASCTQVSKPSSFSSVVYTEYGASAYSERNQEQYFSWIQKMGANTASLLMTCQTQDIHSDKISCNSENSPKRESLIPFFKKAKKLKLNTSLRVYVDLLDGNWRALWDPKDKAKTFANLESLLVDYAQFCETNGIDVFIIGAEYEKLTRPEFNLQWEKIIAKVRSKFKGQITYGANGNFSSYDKPEYAWIPFWSKLDFVGIDHYAPFLGKELTESAFEKHHLQQIAKYQQSTAGSGKPLFFNEVGFPLAEKGYSKPYEWKWSKEEPLNPGVQALNILAFFKAAKSQKAAAIELWRWMPNEANVYHGGYVIENEETVKALKKANSL